MSQKHKFVAGFDPGGQGSFGWCIARIKSGDVDVIDTDCANNADHALACAMKCPPDGGIVAAGIDAPLYWARNGLDREADIYVREQIKAAGGNSGVLTVNSLMGACLIQGAMLAQQIEHKYPRCLITETHPKALLDCKPQCLADIVNGYTEDERDAVISAWAAARAHQRDGQDLFKRDAKHAIHTFLKKTCYWWPKA